MTDLWITVLSNVGALFLGFLLGQGIKWRRTKHGAVPETDFNTKQGQWIFYVVILIAFVSVVQGVVVQNRQAECNNDFREVLKTRAESQSEQTQAQIDFLNQIANPTASPEQRNTALTNYLDKIDDYTITKEKNPYPDPRCGT